MGVSSTVLVGAVSTSPRCEAQPVDHRGNYSHAIRGETNPLGWYSGTSDMV